MIENILKNLQKYLNKVFSYPELKNYVDKQYSILFNFPKYWELEDVNILQYTLDSILDYFNFISKGRDNIAIANYNFSVLRIFDYYKNK